MSKKIILLLATLALSSGCSSTYTQPPVCNDEECVTKLSRTAANTELNIMKAELLRQGVAGQIVTREVSHSFDPSTLIAVRRTSHNISDGNSEVEMRVVEKTGNKASDSSVSIDIKPVKIFYAPGEFQNHDPMYAGVLKAAAKLADYYLKAQSKPSLNVAIVGMASASLPRKGAKLGSLWGQATYTFSDLNNRAKMRRCGTAEMVSKTFYSTDPMTNRDLAMLRAIDLYKRLVSSLDFEIRARATFDLCYGVSPKRGAQYIYSDMNFKIING